MPQSESDPTVVTKLTPCSPGDKGAMEKTWSEVNTEELQEPALTMNDFIRAIQQTRPTVTEDDTRRHVEFQNEAG